VEPFQGTGRINWRLPRVRHAYVATLGFVV
jgi:hypothetical protein